MWHTPPCVASAWTLQFEVEEEKIVNRLQRQLQQVTGAYRALESRMEACGMSPREGTGTHIDTTTE